MGLVVWATGAGAQETERGVIESPSAAVNGIGFISEWKCNAENITLKIWCNNLAGHLLVSMDIPRPDTHAVCDGPDTNNGWIAQVNWNDYQNCTQVEAFITDLTGTGKLEIVLASKPQYNAWRERDDLSIFLAPQLELSPVVD